MATTNAPVGQKLEEEDVYDFIDTFLLQIGVNLLFRYLFLIVIWLIFLVITFYSLSRVDAHDRRLQAREQKKKILAEEKSFQASQEKELILKLEKDKALARVVTKELRQRDQHTIVEEI